MSEEEGERSPVDDLHLQGVVGRPLEAGLRDRLAEKLLDSILLESGPEAGSELRLNAGFLDDFTSGVILDDLKLQIVDFLLEHVDESLLLNELPSDGTNVHVVFLSFGWFG